MKTGTLEKIDAPTLNTISRNEARRMWRQYREAEKEGRAQPGDLEAKGAFKAIAEGKVVIDLAAVMRHAGCDDTGENGIMGGPVLAIAQATAKRVGFKFYDDSSCAFTSATKRVWDRDLSRDVTRYDFHDGRKKHTTKLRDDVLYTDELCADYVIEAVVPTVPPALRPKSRLDRYHVLWEAHWTDAPEDPYLLRQIATSQIYVVVAQWDLTAVERAILSELAPPALEG